MGSFYWKTLRNFKRCNCKDDLVELEAVKSLLQSFRTAEEALAAAEVPNDKNSCFQGRIKTDKTSHLSIESHTLDIVIQAWIFYVIQLSVIYI